MKLISMAKTSTKVNWLLSETLVVVLGVLIAVGLNDYWNRRQERALEMQYLKRIHEDVTADSEVIDKWYGVHLQNKLQALEAIVPIITGEDPVPSDVETFLRNVVLGGTGGTSSTNWVANTTIVDLKATGNFRLIRDVDMRRKIARYYEASEKLYIRSRDRRTGYTAFVFSRLTVEQGAEMELAAIEEISIERAIEGFTSIEFQNLFQQEYNLALFRKQINSSSAKQLATELENYIQELGGSL